MRFLRNNYEQLKDIGLFDKLSWLQIQQIAFKSTFQEYKKGEVFIRQGDPVDGFYCLLSGRLRSYAADLQGRKTDVKFIRRGMHFGITALLADEPHAHSFEAINDSVVLRIHKDDFRDLLKSIPQLGVRLSQSLSQRLRREAREPRPMADSNIISVYCPVKGVGSSTYAAHLAMGLQRETHKRVILVNINTSAAQDAFVTFDDVGAAPRWKIRSVHLQDIIGDYGRIMGSISRGDLAIDLLPVDFNPNDEAIVGQISQFVTALVSDYQYVIVDLPNDMDDVVFQTLTQSDTVQLLTFNREPDLQQTRQVIYKLEEDWKEHFHPDRLQVIVRSSPEAGEFSFEDVNQKLDFNIYARLPSIGKDDLDIPQDSQFLSWRRLNPDSEYARSVRKIAREVGNVLVGLALGGGAALGLTHIGVLRVLEQEKIPVDVVSGSSMGALIGSLWVTGKSADQIEKLAREFETFSGIMRLLDPVIPVAGVIGGRAIKKWLRCHLGEAIFYHTRVPFRVIAYDLMKRRDIVIDSGSLVEAVCRSIAIPGVIAPVVEPGRVIIDGGVLNPLPTDVLKAMGIKKIIAVNVLQSPQDVNLGLQAEDERRREEQKVMFFRNPWAFLSLRVRWGLRRIFLPNISDIIVNTLQAVEYVIAERSAASAADVLIHPDLAGLSWYHFNKVDDMVRRGEAATRQVLNELRDLVEK